MALAVRSAEIEWNGDLMGGKGLLNSGSDALHNLPVSFPARTELPDGKTSPEELIAAAHASCFAMAFTATLGRRNTPHEYLFVKAECAVDRKPEGGLKITSVHLSVRARVPGLDQAGFDDAAKAAEEGCPVSNALRNNVAITVNAILEV